MRLRALFAWGKSEARVNSRSNLFLGLAVLCGALVLLFLWIPFDVDTGLIEKERRRTKIGDALAPTLAGAFLMIGAVGVLLFERKTPAQPALSSANLRFIAVSLGIIVTAFLVMRFTGPAAVWITGTEQEYRLLRDTAPWKYHGFLVGGTILVVGLIRQIEGRFSWKTFAIGLGAVIALILIYDVPFDDLLLPPNGDV